MTTTNIIDTYLDMNYYFSKAVNDNSKVKDLLSNCCEYQGICTFSLDTTINTFYQALFDKSDVFKILFCDDLDSTCQAPALYIRSFDMTGTSPVIPEAFRYKYDVYNRMHGLKYLIMTGASETERFLQNADDRSIILLLRDCKKYTYETDPSITALPITEEVFLETYVSVYDTYSILSQLMIIEMFYLHYKLEDDFVKYDVIMTIINQIKSLDTNVPYNLACVLYAYLVLTKISISKLNIDSAVYPADYWEN